MPSQLELSLILTTYQRPQHLERSLLSLTQQTNMNGRFEVIVADDGSEDRTHSLVRKFMRTANFPLKLITHAHRGFRVALCRNDGVRASVGQYLLFSDSDCLFPPDHLEKHLTARRPMVVRAGNCLRLEHDATERVNSAAIESCEYRRWVTRDERRRLRNKWIKERYYQLIRHPSKPKLTGCNIGISRRDLEAVNGFDETFVGWGCEDDDLAYRLRRAGVRVATALGFTHCYHMWHPTDPTHPGKWNDGPNVEKLARLDRPIKCAAGLIPMPEIDDHRAAPPSDARVRSMRKAA
jgi:glycosyltransferase involved in cell wall biosynthesis